MSVFDIGQIDIIADEETIASTNFGSNVSIDIIGTETELVSVVEMGPQGPPGLQNVYIQPNDPSIEYSWGMEEKDFIWIQTT